MAQIVYTLLGEVDYEFGTIIGVYPTRDQAIEVARFHALDRKNFCHRFKVEGWVVGEGPSNESDWEMSADQIKEGS